jgi:hypothetical protein
MPDVVLIQLTLLMMSTRLLETCKVKVKVKESRKRPGVAQRVPGGLGSQIS